MKNFKYFISALSLSFVAFGCIDKTDPFSTEAYSDLVINEVAANDGRNHVDTWVEIANNSDQEKDLSDLSLYLFDEYFD
jgi:hypothetical protein